MYKYDQIQIPYSYTVDVHGSTGLDPPIGFANLFWLYTGYMHDYIQTTSVKSVIIQLFICIYFHQQFLIWFFFHRWVIHLDTVMSIILPYMVKPPIYLKIMK